jgi:hypothetical protein
VTLKWRRGLTVWVSRRLPRPGTLVRANNRQEFPDPSSPTLEGIPEFVVGRLQIRLVKAPWGAYTDYSIVPDDNSLPVTIDNPSNRCGPITNREMKGHFSSEPQLRSSSRSRKLASGKRTNRVLFGSPRSTC